MADESPTQNGHTENGAAPEATIRGRRKSDELKIAVYDALLAGVKLLAKVMWQALNR